MWNRSSQLMSRKKSWLLMSTASFSPDPSLRVGSRVNNYRCRQSTPAAGSDATHLLQYGHRVARHMYRIQRFIFEDGIKDFVLVFATERRLAQQHLVNQYTERPPIDCTPIALFEQDLKANGQRTCPHRSLSRTQTSGAINSGVPQKVLVVLPYHISSLHKP